MQINLSNHTKIKAEERDDQFLLTLHDLLTGIIHRSNFKKLIKNKLKISKKNIQIFSSNGDLIVKFDNQSQLPERKIIIEEISDIISQYLPLNLENKVTRRKMIYITKESEIPLMGSIYFGIIDRGTNLIQVRPLTGCLLNCPFCSVDEGKHSKTRYTDYIITVPYLVEETIKLINFKGISDIEIHIDGQSEPALYPYLPELVAEFSKNPDIAVISMQTNGVPLNKKYIEKLEKAGLTRINLSINALNPEKSRYLAGTKSYNIKHIKEIARDIVDSSINLLISPLWVPGVNDEDIAEVITFVNNLRIRTAFPILGIQNYLKYKLGRKMRAKMVNIEKFKEKLMEWEEKFDTHPLFLTKKDFNIHPAKTFPKPFRKGDKTEVEIRLPGRLVSKFKTNREMLGTSQDRIIQIVNCTSELNKWTKVKITNTKHNIFYAREINY